jgi:tryptophan synthase alpha chain
MKNRIDTLTKDRKHTVIYLMAGDPDLRATEKLVLDLSAAGVSLIELGVPFSDPVADGKSIQAAGERALKNHVTMKDALALVRRVRKKISTPIVFMTYYNLIFSYGIKKFVNDALSAGVDGAIVPDLPFDEEKDFYNYALNAGFYLIYLVSPSNTAARVKKIVEKTRGFVYYILLKGVTGARSRTEADFSNIKKIKQYTSRPVFAGFGISKPKQAREVFRHADGVIIGSAYVDVIAGCGKNRAKLYSRAGKFVKKFLKEAENAG